MPLHSAHRIVSVKPGTTTLVLRGRRRADDSWSFWVPTSVFGEEAKPIAWDEYLGIGGKVDVPRDKQPKVSEVDRG